MKTTKKIMIKDLKKLNLKGIEILEAQEKSTDDLSLLRLRDSITGTEITVQQSAYSDFYIATDVPPKTEKKWKVEAKINDFVVSRVGDIKRDLEREIETLGEVKDAVYTEIEVPVE